MMGDHSKQSQMARCVVGQSSSSSSSPGKVKLLPLNNRYKIENPLGSFDIQPFLRQILENEYSLKESRPGNRFCVFFAHLLKQVTTLSRYERMAMFNSWWNEELANLELLLYEAMYCINERFDLFFDIAFNAEFFIINHMPKSECVYFYESMVNAAKRHSVLQYGIMLSSFGQVLAFAEIRVSEAHEQYTKALDVLQPLGESRDLAWLYCHIGYIWSVKGVFKKAERDYVIAKEMLQRERTRLQQYEEDSTVSNTSPPWLRQEVILTERILASVLSCLGMLYNQIGNLKLAIDHHEEALSLRRKVFGFHPNVGQCYNNLCVVYERTGEYQKALDYAKKGLQVKRMLVSNTSTTVLLSIMNVASMTYKYEGNLTKALTLIDEAYDIQEVLGLKHYMTAVIFMTRGKIQLNLEQYRQAATSFSNAVDVLREQEGHPRTMAEALRNWGVALKNSGNLDEAERQLRKSIKIIEKVAKDNDKPCEDEDNLRETLLELRNVRAIVESRI